MGHAGDGGGQPEEDTAGPSDSKPGSVCHLDAPRTVSKSFSPFGVFNSKDSSSAAPVKNLPDLSRPPLPPGVPAGGHGGSHGLVMQEFITAIIENRDPVMDVHESRAMTVPGIVAHQSALRDGERFAVPRYRKTGG